MYNLMKLFKQHGLHYRVTKYERKCRKKKTFNKFKWHGLKIGTGFCPKASGQNLSRDRSKPFNQY